MSGHSHSLARDICPDLDGPTVESQLDREHGGDVRAWAKKIGLDPAEIIDFSASINPLGPPASAEVGGMSPARRSGSRTFFDDAEGFA